MIKKNKARFFLPQVNLLQCRRHVLHRFRQKEKSLDCDSRKHPKVQMCFLNIARLTLGFFFRGKDCQSMPSCCAAELYFTSSRKWSDFKGPIVTSSWHSPTCHHSRGFLYLREIHAHVKHTLLGSYSIIR